MHLFCVLLTSIFPGECFGDCTAVLEMDDDHELVPALMARGVSVIVGAIRTEAEGGRGGS